MERNMSVRVYLCKATHFLTAEDDKKFALDVLGLIQGPLDLIEVEMHRRSAFATSEIPRLRMERIYSPADLWQWHTGVIKTMQLSTKPMAGREFCLRALAMALDFGVDIRGELRLAIAMSMHKRVGHNSLLALLSNDLIVMISLMAI
jgi:hypothetical protein